MSARRMCDDVAYAGSPSYELRSIFLVRAPCRISAHVVRPTAGCAIFATEMIAWSRFSIATGSTRGRVGHRGADRRPRLAVERADYAARQTVRRRRRRLDDARAREVPHQRAELVA